jgi:hypothetical protein
VLPARANRTMSGEIRPASPLLLRSPVSTSGRGVGHESFALSRPSDSHVGSFTPSVLGTVVGSPDSPAQAIIRSAIVVAPSHSSTAMPAPDGRARSAAVPILAAPLALPKLLQWPAMIDSSSRHFPPTGFTIHRPLAASGGHTGDLASSIIARSAPNAATMTGSARHSVPLRKPLEANHGADRAEAAVNTTVPMLTTAGSPQPVFLDAAIRSAATEGVYVLRKHSPKATAPAGPIATVANDLTSGDPAASLMVSTAPLSAGEGRSAQVGTADTAAGSSTQPGNVPDIDDLVDRVTRRLTRQLAIDHERRGAPTWR